MARRTSSTMWSTTVVVGGGCRAIAIAYRPLRADRVAQGSDPGHAHLDHVTGREVARRFHRHAYAPRRAGGDDVTRFERDALADVGDQLGDTEDHVGGRCELPELAVDAARHLEGLWI